MRGRQGSSHEPSRSLTVCLWGSLRGSLARAEFLGSILELKVARTEGGCQVTERQHLGPFLTKGSGYEAGLEAEEGEPHV